MRTEQLQVVAMIERTIHNFFNKRIDIFGANQCQLAHQMDKLGQRIQFTSWQRQAKKGKHKTGGQTPHTNRSSDRPTHNKWKFSRFSVPNTSLSPLFLAARSLCSVSFLFWDLPGGTLNETHSIAGAGFETRTRRQVDKDRLATDSQRSH